MKRLLVVALSFSIVGSVMAQSSFTIVRPADGSKVREKVRVLIPKNSLEPGSYVGVFLGGQFVEAVVPPIDATNKDYRVYTLDTKARKIPDGELKLELVKYDGSDTPRIADRSSVTVTVGNQMNIKIPAGGIQLRYGFSSGQQLVYKVMEIESMSTLSGLGNDNGGRPAQAPVSQLVHRILYAVDNTYGTSQMLVRMQSLPDRGKDYAMLNVMGSAEPQQVFEYQMHPVYMRIDRTGRPVTNNWTGAVPEYFGFSSGGSVEGGMAVYGSWPLPVLPSKPVKPGSPAWNVPYQLPMLIDNLDRGSLTAVSQSFPARGEFVSAEWEMGHPCAKIRNSIAAGTRSFKGQELAKAGRAFDDDRVALDETIYFALDTKKIIKMVRSITIDRKIQVEQSGGPGGGSGAPNVGGGGPPGVSGISGAGAGGGDRQIIDHRQKAGGGPQGVGFGTAGGTNPGQRNNPRGGGQGAAPRTQYVRHNFQQIFLLEK